MDGYRTGTVPPHFNLSVQLSGSAVDMDIPIQQGFQGTMLLTLEWGALLSSPCTPHGSLPRNLLQGCAWGWYGMNFIFK